MTKGLSRAEIREYIKKLDSKDHTVQFWTWMDAIYDLFVRQNTRITMNDFYPGGSAVPVDIDGNPVLGKNVRTPYRPVKKAITGYPVAPAPILAFNASVLNSYTKSESAACNCGNQPIEYDYLNLPWSAVEDGNAKDDQLYVDIYSNFTVPNSTDLSYSSTVVRQSSYSWHAPAAGDFRDGLPIGLYLPSSRRFARDFKTIERDFLYPVEGGHTVEDLAGKFFANDGAPKQPDLEQHLRFNENRDGLPYRTREITYEYGACMKPPYGHYSTFELSDTAFQDLYHDCYTKSLENNPVTKCKVTEESLIGYCEKISGLDGIESFGYCFDDPLSFTSRKKLCEQPRASNIALTQTLGVRSPANICSKTSSVCLIIPDEPGASLNAVLNTPELYGDLTGYTMLIAPFNHTVALTLMGPQRFKYETGTLDLMPVEQNDTEFLGVKALSEGEFKLLYDQSDGVDVIVGHMDSIVEKLSTKHTGDKFDMPFITDVPSSSITYDYLFPPFEVSGVAVNHVNVTIRSASSDPLQIIPRTVASVSKPPPCTLFYVGAPGFTINNTNVDFTTCPHADGMGAAAIVFGAEDVSNSVVRINVTGTEEPAVLFAGGDIEHFAMFPVVKANNVEIILPSYTNPKLYAIAAAKTHGDIDINCPSMINESDVHVLVQPATSTTNNRDKTLTVTVGKDGTPIIIDVSKYTQVFGNNVLELAYPQTHAKEHFHLGVFIFSVTTITFITTLFLYRWIAYFMHYIHEGSYDDGVEVHTTLFGQVVTFADGQHEQSVAEYSKQRHGTPRAPMLNNVVDQPS